MKHLIKAVFVSLLLASSLMAYDTQIMEKDLPAASKAFLKKYFSNDAFRYGEKDFDSYEVYLESGVEIEFRIDGSWKQVDGNYRAIPTGFIPKAVMNTLEKSYKGASVIKVEYKMGGRYYEIELDNRMELKISENGSMLRQEYDD